MKNNLLPIIEISTFSSLKESVGEDFIGELIAVYFDETPQLLSRLQKAFDEQDLETFTRAAHSIKSTSNSFGALQLGTMAKELEMMGRSGNLEGAPARVEALISMYEEVRQTLEEISHGK